MDIVVNIVGDILGVVGIVADVGIAVGGGMVVGGGIGRV